MVAFEAGRDGFWLARWLRARDIEAYVIHPTSVAVSREHRRAKTDRLDTGLLKRVFLGWLRGEPDHCHMAAIPTLAEEDARPRGCHDTPECGTAWNGPASSSHQTESPSCAPSVSACSISFFGHRIGIADAHHTVLARAHHHAGFAPGAASSASSGRPHARCARS